jgi:hypothetical protein
MPGGLEINGIVPAQFAASMPIITVGSVDTDTGVRSTFSQGSPMQGVLTISAPGNEIDLADFSSANDFLVESGTSFCKFH